MHYEVARRLPLEEALIVSGRNARLAAEVLGEALRAFELGRGLRRPEGADAGGSEIVDQSGNQRRFRSDDDEVDFFPFAEGDDRRVVFRVERNAIRDTADAGIAGSCEEFSQQRRGRERPRKCMLSAS